LNQLDLISIQLTYPPNGALSEGVTITIVLNNV